MNKRGRHMRVHVIIFIASIVLIVTSTPLLLFSIDRYNDAVASNQDTYFFNSVRYVDRNLSIQLDAYRSELEYVISQVGFARIEHAWLESGDQQAMLNRMRGNLLAEDQYIHTLLCLRGNDILLSTCGHTDFRLQEDFAAKPISSAEGPDGRLYLALPHTRNDLTYLALVDLEKYFSVMQQALPVDTDRLFFYEATEDHFIHMQNGRVETVHGQQFTDQDSPSDVLRAFQESYQSQQPRTLSYRSGEEERQMRLVVIPAQQLTNGILSLGMSLDYDAITMPLRSGLRMLLACEALLFLGIALLVAAAILFGMGNVKRNRELEELQRKNEEMATLTERTMNLYHHQRLETIGTMTSSIAHEFGNLLTPIMGYSIMTMEALPPECEDLADNLHEIYEASCNAKTIISRLSDLSRKNTGASYVYLSPDELVRRMMSVAQPSVPDEVTTELDLNAADVKLHGNETQLSQMLLNLLINACHAMHSTKGKLTVSTSREGELLRIRVKDTGTGIRPEIIDKIFDPFFTTRESGKGTGLGLAISLQVAREHGGDITVSSCLGEGSTFDVILPTAQPPVPED